MSLPAFAATAAMTATSEITGEKKNNISVIFQYKY